MIRPSRKRKRRAESPKKESSGYALSTRSNGNDKHKGAGKGCLRRKVNKNLRPDGWEGMEIDE